ncbi:hypothetical protein [Streptomyces sp. CC77]|uniref:hypothetical protein n=1 Tax=Streptomyces sp. CC77 TaxID=1906739 RepID=UPI0008DE88FC|nr:hypothetical protein [Streptomyces sp. CC77]OII67463.1 hypothetical protein BJP39_00995 [Streptomyces sp. CC77]
MSKTASAWFHSITDSVFALGAAAREFRAAHEAARLASWNTDRTRLQYVEGEVSVPELTTRTQPHDHAVWLIHDHCSAHERRLGGLYEGSARTYAYGTASAVLAVLDGRRPRHVELRRSGLGTYTVPGGRLPDLQPRLERWAGCRQLSALHQAVLDHEHAAAAAEQDADSEGVLTDHEAAALTRTSTYATGTADALYAYGEAAERALHFALTSHWSRLTPEEQQ